MLPQINRRGWLASWAQDRRRKRQIQLLPAPVLRAQYPDKLAWDWDLPNPYKWNVWLSSNGGDSWLLVDDYWTYGNGRLFAPDGGGELYYIVGVDVFGREITEHSNLIRPDDAPLPTSLLTGLLAHFGFEETSGNRMDNVNGFGLAPINSNPGSAMGIVGNAVAFNGSGSYLAGTAETDAFMPSTDGLAISVWVNFANSLDPYATAYIASFWNDTAWPTGSVWHLFACPNFGSASAEVVGEVSGFNGLYGTGSLSDWAQLCLVYEPSGNLWSLYLNGAVVATANCDYQAVAGYLGVGAHTNPITPTPDFLVDELTIWERALSAAEVSQLYNNGDGLPYEMF